MRHTRSREQKQRLQPAELPIGRGNIPLIKQIHLVAQPAQHTANAMLPAICNLHPIAAIHDHIAKMRSRLLHQHEPLLFGKQIAFCRIIERDDMKLIRNLRSALNQIHMPQRDGIKTSWKQQFHATLLSIKS